MHRAYTLLILGVWVAILPYLGFPYSWKDYLFTASGIALISFSYVMYKESKTKKGKKETYENFSENL